MRKSHLHKSDSGDGFLSKQPWIRSLALFLAAKVISGFGSSLTKVALAVYIYQKTHRALGIGVALVLFTVPMILLGPFFGSLADRTDKRLWSFGLNLGMGVLTLGYLLPGGLAGVYAVALLIACLGSAFNTLLSTMIPALVPREGLIQANSASSVIQGVLDSAGPVLGAAVVAFAGTRVAFLLDAASFLVAGVIFLAIRFPQVASAASRRPGRASSFIADTWQGTKYVVRHEAFRFYFVFGLSLAVIAVMRVPLLLPYVEEHLGRSTVEFGWLGSAAGIGGIAGGLIFSMVGKRVKNLSRWYLALLIVDGLAVLALGLTTSWFVAALLFALGGILGTMENVVMNTALQTIIPPQAMGRVFGVLGAVFGPVTAMAYLLGSAAGDAWGIATVFIGAGVLETTLAVLARWMPGYAGFFGQKPIPLLAEEPVAS